MSEHESGNQIIYQCFGPIVLLRLRLLALDYRWFTKQAIAYWTRDFASHPESHEYTVDEPRHPSRHYLLPPSLSRLLPFQRGCEVRNVEIN